MKFSMNVLVSSKMLSSIERGLEYVRAVHEELWTRVHSRGILTVYRPDVTFWECDNAEGYAGGTGAPPSLKHENPLAAA